MNRVRQQGFTLIELVVVMIIVGILAAIITPKYINLRTDATNAAKQGVRGAVQSAWAVSIANKVVLGNDATGFPTVTELSSFVNGGTAISTGIQVKIGNDLYTVLTYSDPTCTTNALGACQIASSGAPCTQTTAAVTDIVTCVGDISGP